MIRVTANAFSKNEALRARLADAFPGCAFNETGKRFTRGELIEFLSEADGAVVGLDVIDDDVLAELPKLRCIAKYGVGLNNIDLDAAKKRNVSIQWRGGVNRRSVSELALAFMLGLARNVFRTGYQLKSDGTWNKSGGLQLSEKTVGIIGCGYIGTDLLQLLQAFHCNVLIHDIVDKSETATRFGARLSSFNDVLRSADFVTLHVPLTNLTHHMIRTETLEMMKPTAYLINTARGEIVDQAALKAALQNGTLAGAALDVFDEEPPGDLEFLALPNLMVSPHIGGNAREAVLAMGEAAIQGLQDYFSND